MTHWSLCCHYRQVTWLSEHAEETFIKSRRRRRGGFHDYFFNNKTEIFSDLAWCLLLLPHPKLEAGPKKTRMLPFLSCHAHSLNWAYFHVLYCIHWTPLRGFQGKYYLIWDSLNMGGTSWPKCVPVSSQILALTHLSRPLGWKVRRCWRQLSAGVGQIDPSYVCEWVVSI